MAKKKKVSLSDSPHYQAAFNKAKMQAAASRAQRAQNAKNIRKQGWQMAKEGLYDGIVQNSIDVIDGAVSGAMKAFGPGDKKTMIKGAIEGVADTHAVKKALNALGKFGKGVAKGILNDLQWYNNYPSSSNEMIGPNFNVRMGVNDPLLYGSPVTYKPSIGGFGTIRIELVRGDDTNMVISSAINRIYSSIRRANSGSTNWDPYQLDAYIYNYRRIIAVYETVNRALSYLNKATILDKNVPYGLFAALGFDYNDISLHAADLRNYLLNFRIKLSSYAIPSFDILKRTQWLFANGYWDSNDIKHQTYFIFPCITSFYKMSSNSLATLSTSFVPSLSSSQTGLKFTDIQSVLDELLGEFLGNDIYSIISGDTVRAFGTDTLFRLTDVKGIDALPSEGYAEEVLQQIQNAWTAKTTGSSQLAATLTHNTGAVGLTETLNYTETTYSNMAANLLNETYLNMYKNDISNLDVLGASRLVSFSTRDGASYTLAAYGTEVFLEFQPFYFNYGPGNMNIQKVDRSRLTSVLINFFTTDNNVESFGTDITEWTTFDWAPRLVGQSSYYVSTGGTYVQHTKGTSYTLFDFNVYAKINTVEQLRGIHDVATQSLYYAPLKVRESSSVVDIK